MLFALFVKYWNKIIKQKKDINKITQHIFNKHHQQTQSIKFKNIKKNYIV